MILTSSVLFRDEVTELAENFNEMVEKVYQRETKLAEKVTKLKIFIDEGSRKEDLDQIADSEFFKQFQDNIKANKAAREKKTAT